MHPHRDIKRDQNCLLPDDRRGFLFSCIDIGGISWQDDWFWCLNDSGYRYSEIGFEAFQTIDFNRAASDDPEQYFKIGLKFVDDNKDIKARWDNIEFDLRTADLVKFHSHSWPFTGINCKGRLVCTAPGTLVLELSLKPDQNFKLQAEVWLKSLADKELEVSSSGENISAVSEGKRIFICGEGFTVDNQKLNGIFNLKKREKNIIRLSMSAAEKINPEGNAIQGQEIDLDEIEEKIMSYYKDIPRIDTGNKDWDRLFYAVFDNKRGNTLKIPKKDGPFFECPNRPRHNSLWLWDSCFHSFVSKIYDLKDVAAIPLLYLLELQDETSGFVPITFDYKGIESSQPPLISWTLNEVTEEVEILEKAYPRLVKFHNWWEDNRKIGKNLYSWHHGGESGMDNSPRWDDNTLERDLACIDLNVQLCLDCHSLSRIATKIGLKKEAKAWQNKYEKLNNFTADYFWDGKDGFFYDRFVNGDFHRIKTISSFWSMLAHIASNEQVESMINYLLDPEEFNTPYPFPTVSISEETFTVDYIRGGTWMMMNFVVILGMEENGHKKRAREFAAKMIEMVNREYLRTGFLWECYNPFTGKGEYVEKKNRGPRTIAEYFCGWTGLVAELMWRYDFTDNFM